MRGELKKKVTKAQSVLTKDLGTAIRKELVKTKPAAITKAPAGLDYDLLVKKLAFEAVRFVKLNKLAPQNKLVRLAKQYEAQYR